MDDYYVYEHRRISNGSTFYVGKGRKYRAWAKSQRNTDWQRIAKNGFTVHIIQNDMSEADALALERGIIADYGLCNLANRSHGGQGAGVFTDDMRQAARERAMGRPGFWKGKKRPPETVKKMSEGNSKEKHPRWGLKGDANPLYGRKHSEEHCRKISESNKGKMNSPEARAKISAKKTGEGHHMFDKTIYLFEHWSGETRQATQYAFRNEFGFHQSAVRRLVLGERKSSLHGWKIA